MATSSFHCLDCGTEALLRAGKLPTDETVLIPVTGQDLRAADKLDKLLDKEH